MHEFSIALSIIEIAENEAKKAKSSRVSELVLDIGTMAGIEFHALDFAMESATKDTMLQKAKIVINKIQAIGKCKDCHHEFNIQSAFDQCPKCNGYFINVLSGKEMKVKSLVVE
ncbi:MAG: hydrogenase maturation nickel metallochaperone HypA [Marinilabiliales bacterium]|nr:MAG: hydrogenase maturation nickel metallochaperone HypA [Marinilabiliales bacterium]